MRPVLRSALHRPNPDERAPIVNVEGGCATASLALSAAFKEIRAGDADLTLALGVEKLYDPDNQGSSGNNVVSCYAGPLYSAGFAGSGGNCVTGASFLHPVDAHRPRTIQFGLKLGF